VATTTARQGRTPNGFRRRKPAARFAGQGSGRGGYRRLPLEHSSRARRGRPPRNRIQEDTQARQRPWSGRRSARRRPAVQRVERPRAGHRNLPPRSNLAIMPAAASPRSGWHLPPPVTSSFAPPLGTPPGGDSRRPSCSGDRRHVPGGPCSDQPARRARRRFGPGSLWSRLDQDDHRGL